MTQRPARGAARLAAILDALPDALLLVDARGLVVNANARALEMFETVAGPLVGRPIATVLPDFDYVKAAGRTRRRKRRQGERTHSDQGAGQRTDGTGFTCDVSTSLLTGTTEDDLLIVIVRAVEESAGHTAELARQQRQTEMILRAASEAIVGVDADGKIILANPAAARMMRTKAADLAGKDLHDFAHHSRSNGSPNPRDASPIAETLRSGRRQKAREATLWRQDGSPLPVEVSTLPVTENDVLAGAIVTYTDRGETESAKARRDDLVHILRRELGRPLRRARNEIARVAASEYGQVSPEAAGALDEIAAGLDRLVRVISDALDQERSKQEPSPSPSRADALKLVQLAVDAVGRTAESAGVEISADADPVEIELDEERFVQALSTVLSSAVRSAPAGSTVTVAAKQRGEHLRVVVRGTGTGMPPQITPRVDPASSPIDVGIPVARRLIDQLGGTMTIFSSPADGTSCTIELPLPAQPTGPTDLAPAPPLPETAPPAPDWNIGADIPSARRPTGEGVPEYGRATGRGPSDGAYAGASPRQVDSPTTLTSLPTVPAATMLPAVPPAVLAWPQPHEATVAAFTRKGWQSLAVATPHDLTAYLAKQPTAVLVDPLTGPVTRTALQAIRSAAAEALVPLLVAAGLGEVAADALYGSDPAALLRALTPRGRPNTRPARVLLIEADAALATTFGARLERRGMEVIHATSESEAVLRAAITSPDLVVVDLMLTRTSGPGIVDWLRLHERLPATPLVAYTTSGLTSDAYDRLRRGESALFLQGRAETSEVEDRITLLVERMSTTL